MRRSAGGLVRDVGRLLRDGVDPPGGDARLLQRFAADRDASAFEAIVDRHGPPVLAVCRRYLKDPADVEDAFQATFLVLVRKASGLRDGDALSSWLYGVAYRVAVRARSDALRRRGREGEREGLQDAPAEPSRPVDDAPEILDGELSRLPEKYRAPLVLCYLEGRTHDQAAAELGWPVGTVRSRMAKGRSLLRERLTRRGVDAPACLAALRADVAAIPSVPSSLVAATASAAVRFAGLPAGLAWLGASPSSSTWPAARLALGVLATMSTTPWKLIGLTLACAGLTAGTLAAGFRHTPGGPQDPPEAAPPPAAEKPAPPDVEGRLSEVENKLDRMMEMLEALKTGPSPAPTANLGATPGLAPPAPAPFEARTLREIEAQLVSLERKYRIVDRFLGGQNALVATFEAESLREDAVAPARVLVARLRELEDGSRADLVKMTPAFGVSAEILDDPVKLKAAAEEAYREAMTQLDQSEAALKELPGYPNEIYGAQQKYSDVVQHRERIREAVARLAMFIDRTPPPGIPTSGAGSSMRTLEPIYEKLAEVRRLIAWAKSHFPDVELTTADAPAPQGDAAK